MKNKNIFVTQASLPDLKDFIPYLVDIWDSKWLTNNGKYHQQLEKELAEFLGVKYVSLFSNGTLALISALQVLNISGEVITTPYSFVATTHSLWWNNIKPVFVDIESDYCNIDPDKIAAAITPKTTAILPVHVYGNPSNFKKIQEIADNFKLKVIYDAAHAFDVSYKGQSVLNFGDLSILSFHATKVYNTFEGGAIICHDEETKKKIDYLKNFGFAGETEIIAPGINAKMNEIQAAYGVLQLKEIKTNIQKRKKIAEEYSEKLKNVPGINILKINPNINYNYPYYPIFIDSQEYGLKRDELYNKLQKNNIYGRRYFYPIISEFPMYKELESANRENLSIAYKKSTEVICLPIYPDIKIETINRITDIIINK